MKVAIALIALVGCGLVALAGRPQPAVEFTPGEVERILGLSPLGPPPPDPTNRVADDPRAARLGQFLFFDTRLSRNGEVSCATCHDPALGFSDGKQIAEGTELGTRNTQTLWNVAYGSWFFWDGRADSLWAQALKPIERDLEMASTRLELAHLIHREQELRDAYESIFGGLPPLDDAERFPARGRPTPVSPESDDHEAWLSMTYDDQRAVDTVFANVGKAIAAYERRLVSRRSAFDVFVEGLADGDASKLDAIGPSAQRGLKLFVGRANCRLCHNGPNLSDGAFHNNRVAPVGGGAPRDAGRYAAIDLVTSDPFNLAGAHTDEPTRMLGSRLRRIHKDPHQWGEFKTPSLRNVALTAPYMHQGQFEDLGAVLRHYSTLEGALPLSRHQEVVLAPLGLTNDELADLEAFLGSLTDTAVDPGLLTAPASPRLRR